MNTIDPRSCRPKTSPNAISPGTGEPIVALRKDLAIRAWTPDRGPSSGTAIYRNDRESGDCNPTFRDHLFEQFPQCGDKHSSGSGCGILMTGSARFIT
jgi:hypothetical protein